MKLKNINPKAMKATLIILMIACLLGLAYAIYRMWRQWKELNDWRDSLKPGDKVVVVGFEHPQTIIHRPGDKTYVICGERWWSQCHVVSRSDIFPFEPPIEWEIVHE